MFCPNCGRDNSREQRFCASCGTNLEVVSQALSGTRDDFFTRTDMMLDQFIARYAEHVFKDATANASERKVSRSWKILGQGVVTSLFDMFLFFLLWNVMPLRFFILMLSTPFRMFSQRGKRNRDPQPELEIKKQPALPEPQRDEWVPGQVISVSEHTTERLEEYRESIRNRMAERE